MVLGVWIEEASCWRLDAVEHPSFISEALPFIGEALPFHIVDTDRKVRVLLQTRRFFSQRVDFGFIWVVPILQ